MQIKADLFLRRFERCKLTEAATGYTTSNTYLDSLAICVFSTLFHNVTQNHRVTIWFKHCGFFQSLLSTIICEEINWHNDKIVDIQKAKVQKYSSV